MNREIKFLTVYASTKSEIQKVLQVRQPKSWQVIKDNYKQHATQYLVIMELQTTNKSGKDKA